MASKHNSFQGLRKLTLTPKRPISASVRAENVVQRFYPNLEYMSQHVARAKSGADGHNGRV